MIGYFYECPACGRVHEFDPNHEQTFSELPERICPHCSEQGCTRCVSDDGCRDCRDDFDCGIDFDLHEPDYDGLNDD